MYLNKDEAIFAMKSGQWVSHEYFDDYEAMTIDPEDNQILFEDGCRCSQELFWADRTCTGWETGYFTVANPNLNEEPELVIELIPPPALPSLDYNRTIGPEYFRHKELNEKQAKRRRKAKQARKARKRNKVR